MIRFTDVHKSFDGREVLAGVSFEVKDGEILAVIGSSGSGKSVSLKHIVGLLTPDSGRIEMREGLRVGYLFQGGALLAWLTVRENVALPLKETTIMTDEEIDRSVDEALESVGLTDAADKYPAEISGGMVKRAGLARELVRNSDVILYDEPTSGLDPVTARNIHRLIKRVNLERNLTSVVVTHDLAGACSFADRILLLSGGRVLVAETPEKFLQLRIPEVLEFVSASKGVL